MSTTVAPPLAARIAEVDYFLGLPDPAHRIHTFLVQNPGSSVAQIKRGTGIRDGMAVTSWLWSLRDHGLACTSQDSRNRFVWTAVQCEDHDWNPHRVEWRAPQPLTVEDMPTKARRVYDFIAGHEAVTEYAIGRGTDTPDGLQVQTWLRWLAERGFVAEVPSANPVRWTVAAGVAA